MLPSNEPRIKHDDKTPSIIEQAHRSGWSASFYDFGKADNPSVSYFNAGLVKRPDGLWLLARRAQNQPGSPFGMNSIVAFKLDDSGRKLLHGVPLKWTHTKAGQHYEDARGFYVDSMGQTGVSACTFQWHGDRRWTGAIQVLGFFDNDWTCKITHFVPFSGNATELTDIPKERYEKNWLFWRHNDKLHLLYKSAPWIIATFGSRWSEREVFHGPAATWNFGEIRGGTPPVLVDGVFYTFFHSSVSWRGNYRRYYMGALAFEAEPPYHLISVTAEPLLIGSQNDPWEMRKPPCVFPVGAVLRNGAWLVSMGVNDMKTAWVEIPHVDLIKRLGTPSLPVVATVKQAAPKKRKVKKRKKVRTPEEQEKINARMAKARASRKTLEKA